MNIYLFSVVVFWSCFPTSIAGETKPSGIDASQTERSFNRTSGPMGNQIVTTFKVSVVELDSTITWVNAEKQCNNSGGHLISIANDDENDLIYSMLSTTMRDCWIGLLNIGGLDSSSNTETNNWRWIDGTHFSYHNWSKGQPDNWNGHESCGEIHGSNRGESSLWDDHDCKNSLNCFICGNVIAIEPVILTTTFIPTTSTTTTALTTTSTSAKTSTTPPNGSTLLTTEASIAIIILACIFSLTTVCLIVILFITNRKHARALIMVRQQLIHNIIARTAGKGANGLELQSTNQNTYYDTQNREVGARYEDVLNTTNLQ